jgi:hypothetical protein
MDPIRRLIKRADEVASPPALRPDLPDLIPGLARRRRANRIAALTAAAIVAMAASLWFAWAFRPGPQAVRVVHTPIQQSADLLRAEAARLAREAQIHQSIADRLLLAERHWLRMSQLRQTLAAPDPLEETQRQRDAAALFILRQAERLWADESRRPEAQRRYRNAIELFPESPWAAVAAQRLANIGT